MGQCYSYDFVTNGKCKFVQKVFFSIKALRVSHFLLCTYSNFLELFLYSTKGLWSPHSGWMVKCRP